MYPNYINVNEEIVDQTASNIIIRPFCSTLLASRKLYNSVALLLKLITSKRVATVG